MDLHPYDTLHHDTRRHNNFIMQLLNYFSSPHSSHDDNSMIYQLFPKFQGFRK